jgi:hypothetical protein
MHRIAMVREFFMMFWFMVASCFAPEVEVALTAMPGMDTTKDEDLPPLFSRSLTLDGGGSGWG